MENKHLVMISVFALVVLLLGIFLVSIVSASQGEGNMNISVLFDNNTLYSHTNASVILNWTVNNGTTLLGGNFSLILDGVVLGIFCNSSTTVLVQSFAGVNSSGCSAMGVVNTLFLNVSEGLHTINIVGTHGAGQVSNSSTWNTGSAATNYSGNTSFFVTNFDSLAWASTVPADYSNHSRAAIFANVTFNSIIASNISFGLMNFTLNPVWANITILGNSTTTSSNYTWPGLPNNHYTYNASLITAISGVNLTGNALTARHIILDTLAPNVSYSCSGWYNEDETSVEKDSTSFSCSCSATEENATIGANPGAVYNNIDTAVDVTTTGEKGTVCTVGDHAGNNRTHSIVTYNVVEVINEGVVGAGGGGGSSTQGRTTTIGGTVYTISSNQFEAGQTKTLKANDGFRVSFTPSAAEVAEFHVIKVGTIGVDYADIIVESEPVTIRLKIGEEKSVDVDADGTYDVAVKLNSIADNKADLTIKQTSVAVPEGEGTVSGGTGIPEGEGEPAKGGISVWVWIIAVLVIIIIAVVVLMARKKK